MINKYEWIFFSFLFIWNCFLTKCQFFMLHFIIIFLFVHRIFSEQKINFLAWECWCKISNAFFFLFDILFSAKIKFLRMQSSSNENKGFIVAEEDRTFIQFEVSGSNSVHSFKGIDGPQFYYTTIDGVSHKVNVQSGLKILQ